MPYQHSLTGNAYCFASDLRYAKLHYQLVLLYTSMIISKTYHDRIIVVASTEVKLLITISNLRDLCTEKARR